MEKQLSRTKTAPVYMRAFIREHSSTLLGKIARQTVAPGAFQENTNDGMLRANV